MKKDMAAKERAWADLRSDKRTAEERAALDELARKDREESERTLREWPAASDWPGMLMTWTLTYCARMVGGSEADAMERCAAAASTCGSRRPAAHRLPCLPKSCRAPVAAVVSSLRTQGGPTVKLRLAGPKGCFDDPPPGTNLGVLMMFPPTAVMGR